MATASTTTSSSARPMETRPGRDPVPTSWSRPSATPSETWAIGSAPVRDERGLSGLRGQPRRVRLPGPGAEQPGQRRDSSARRRHRRRRRSASRRASSRARCTSRGAPAPASTSTPSRSCGRRPTPSRCTPTTGAASSSPPSTRARRRHIDGSVASGQTWFYRVLARADNGGGTYIACQTQALSVTIP